MAIFKRKQDVGAALELALTRVLESQAKNVEVMGSFLEKMGELSIKRAAQALGSRGGQKRAERAKAKREAVDNRECRLCRDPFSTHLSIAEVEQHRLHKLPPPSQPVQ